MSKAVPELRFPGFMGEWQIKSVGRLLKRASDPVRVEPEETYREIGVRSHGRGVFHKAPVSGAELGDKRVFHVVPDALVLNIVFAWEQAVAMTSSDEQGFIASHRFPMFLENAGQSYLPFIRQLLLTPRGKVLLEIASPGGAGRNKTLGQDAFLKLKTRVPERDEQKHIADFLDATSRKITLLTDKKTALEDYKRGLMQRLFSRELRFTRDDGSAFPDWEVRKLGDVATFFKGKGISKSDIAEGGALPCIRYGEIYTHYRERITEVISFTNGDPASLFLSEIGDVIIPASGEDRMDMARACCVAIAGVALGGDINVLRSPINGDYLAYYLNNARRREIANLGQGNSVVHLYPSQLRTLTVALPHPDEQHKIAAALSALDTKIDALSQKISEMEAFKKGLLQKLFV